MQNVINTKSGIWKWVYYKFNVLRAVAGITYKEWAAYRTHSMVSILIGPCYFFIQMLIWKAVYSNNETVNGMTLQQIVLYYGISTLIVYIIMDFADWNLQMLIRTGKYTTFALRPIHHGFFALSQKVGHRILGLIFEFIPVLLIFIFVFKINMIPAHWGYTVISLIFSSLLNFLINYSIGTTGFWLTKTNGLKGVINIFSMVCSGALIPLTFFPDWAQKFLFFLPFQFVTYVPAMVYQGSYSLAGKEVSIPQIVIIQGIYVIIMLCITELLYKFGNKRFTGVGT